MFSNKHLNCLSPWASVAIFLCGSAQGCSQVEYTRSPTSTPHSSQNYFFPKSSFASILPSPEASSYPNKRFSLVIHRKIKSEISDLRNAFFSSSRVAKSSLPGRFLHLQLLLLSFFPSSTFHTLESQSRQLYPTTHTQLVCLSINNTSNQSTHKMSKTGDGIAHYKRPTPSNAKLAQLEEHTVRVPLDGKSSSSYPSPRRSGRIEVGMKERKQNLSEGALNRRRAE